jgi:hypothetical protein
MKVDRKRKGQVAEQQYLTEEKISVYTHDWVELSNKKDRNN